MNVRNLLAGTALAAVGLFSGVAHADHDGVIKSSNFLGPTGYIMTPNAYVQSDTSFSIGTHFVRGAEIGRVRLPDVAVVHGTLGLFDWAEVGGAYRIVFDNPVPNAAYMNAKVRLTPASFPLAIAGGVQDGTNSIARNIYGVATLDVLKAMGHGCGKKVGPIQSFQVGGGYRWQSDLGGFPVPAINAPFANGAIQIGKSVQLMAEWNPDQNLFLNGFYPAVGEVNAGLRFAIGVPGLAIDIAGIGLDNDARTYGGGLNYTFAFGKSHAKKDEDCAVPATTQTAENVFASRPAAVGLAAHLAR
jgi:hypothetical protein